MPRSSKKLIALSMTALLLTACNEGTDSVPRATPKPPAAATEQPPVATAEQTAAPTAPATPPKASLDDPNVVVIVNGAPVTKSMYATFHQQWRRARKGAKGDTPQEQMAILNELINAMLIVQDAEAQGFDKKPEVAELLALLRTRALAEMSIANFVQQQTISDSELQTLYDQRYGSKEQREFKARHILLKSEDDARAVIKALEGGADFVELAKQRSAGPSASQGGDLGWFDASQMVKPFSDAVAAMTPGNYSKTPVKTQFGWHVILLEDARNAPPPAFEEVKNGLLDEKRRERVIAYLGDLRKKANIQIRPPAQPPGADGTEKAAP